MDLIEALKAFLLPLGLKPTTEVFPKQKELQKDDKGDIKPGNFINLPYFDSDKTVRYAVDDKGKDLSLEQFIAQAEKKQTSLYEINKIDFGTRREEFSDAPPCLQGFLNLGVPQGARNTVLFNVCTYCQKKDKDTWQKMFEDINQKYSSPPLPATEIVALQKQHEKKEYQYQCNVEPLKSHCDKQVCKTRKFGVGNGNTYSVKPYGEIGGTNLNNQWNHYVFQHLTKIFL